MRFYLKRNFIRIIVNKRNKSIIQEKDEPINLTITDKTQKLFQFFYFLILQFHFFFVFFGVIIYEKNKKNEFTKKTIIKNTKKNFL